MVRFPLKGFKDVNQVEVLNIAKGDSSLQGYVGGFTDGRHGYLVPHFLNGKMMGKVGKKVLAPIRELHRGGSYGGYLNSPTAKKRRSGNYMAELVEFKDKRENFSVTFQAQEMSEDISQGELYCIK